jgi:hypothetical protein
MFWKSANATTAALLLSASMLCATVVGVDTIEQPINLGANADPSRIPLGPVAVETNHGYGRHLIISAPRPCTHGSLALQQGLALNMNLASVFGIEVAPEDPTNVPAAPVVIRVKDWPAPSYSPYRRDQVVAAVIHCLLRSVQTTPRTPLDIVIKAENQKDQQQLQGYSGHYYSDGDRESNGPTPVPGCELASDARGVTHVVLSEASAPPPRALLRPAPSLIPFLPQDDLDDHSYAFVPVWAGDDWPFAGTLISQPVTLFHDLFDPSRTSGPDINAITSRRRLTGAKFADRNDFYTFSISALHPADNAPADLTEALCAAIQAAVLTALPTEQKPLRVQIEASDSLSEQLAPFAASRDWVVEEERPGKSAILITGTLAWDPAAGTFTSGSLPRGSLQRSLEGSWELSFPLQDAISTRALELPE